jgi:hypothetical protein
MAYITDLPDVAKRLVAQGHKPSVRYFDKGMEANDSWYVPFEYMTTFLRTVGGTVENIGGILNRVVPLRFAEYTWCIAYDCNVEYVGWNATTNNFKGIQARISYRTPPYPVDGTDAFMTLGTQSQTYAIPAPAGILSGSGGSVSNDRNLDCGGMTFRLDFHKLASFDPSTYVSVGTVVNLNIWRSFAPGTVKFEGVGANRTTTFNGMTSWEVSYPFQVRYIPWNYEFMDNGSLGAVSYNGTPRYASADFSSVFGF